MKSPFAIETDKPFVTIKGKRNGYIQLATSKLLTTYSELPNELLLAAKAWAQILETHGAKRVYWITLSEVVDHLHIHLYPRWSDTEPKGLDLFNLREAGPQPEWTDEINLALAQFAQQFNVEII